MEKLKKYKGITLISLILTIIILIIISGITISMLLGNDGIINRARYAKDSYTNATNDEQEKLNDLENLFSKILVGSNSTVELSMEQLNEYIDQRVNQKLSETTISNPTGTVISYMGNNAPTGYLKCDGTVYNISDYKDLAEQIKNEFNSYNYYGGDGTTTFAVPDLRGEFLRGTGTNSHSNQGNGATVGTHQNATKHIFWGINQDASDLWIQTLGKSDSVSLSAQEADSTFYNSNTTGRYWRQLGTFNGNGLTFYSARPTNTSVLYCIKY